MPSRRIEQQLESLKSLRERGPTEETVLALRKALGDRVNLVIAKAAGIAAEMQLTSLVPDLLNAFGKLFENAVHADPQCWGKNALSKALKDLEYSGSGAFVRGLQHVQMEPVWGKRVDTAAVLRGTCALALVQSTDLPRQEKLRCLVDTLADPEAPVRIDAARAIREMEGIEAALLLRLKALVGDLDARVIGQVLESFLGIEGETGVPFVSGFLSSGMDEVREEAALALGVSRLPGAVTALITAWNQTLAPSLREVILRVLSTSRQQSAVEFLLKTVREGHERDALAALQALEPQGRSTDVHTQIGEAVQTRSETAIHDYFRKHFLR
ncbi:MAG: hypothetical protein WB992_08945 [Bryobacteraceae bacterium]